jgi:hypothetical protein
LSKGLTLKRHAEIIFTACDGLMVSFVLDVDLRELGRQIEDCTNAKAVTTRLL